MEEGGAGGEYDALVAYAFQDVGEIGWSVAGEDDGVFAVEHSDAESEAYLGDSADEVVRRRSNGVERGGCRSPGRIWKKGGGSMSSFGDGEH